MTQPCPTCEQQRVHRLYRGADFTIVACATCGLVRKSLDDELTRSTVQQLQDQVYREVEHRVWLRKLHVRMAQDRLDLLQRFIQRGALLEIGCATGEFLAAARTAGFEVLGVDASRKYAAFAREQEVPVLYGRLEDVDLDQGVFDVVGMFHLIEHLEDPPAFLEALRPHLASGGYVFIATPNVEAITNKMLGYQHPNYHQEDHLFFFSAQTLRDTLTKAGFEPVAIVSKEYPHHIFTSIYNVLARKLKPARAASNDAAPVLASGDGAAGVARGAGGLRAAMKRSPYALAQVLYPGLRLYGRWVERQGGGHELLALAQKRD